MILFIVKIFLIVVFPLIKEAESRAVSGERSTTDTCESCVNAKRVWVTLPNGTSKCVLNMAGLGLDVITADTKSIDCETSPVAENTNNSTNQVGDYNYSSNNYTQPKDLAKKAQSIIMKTQAQMNLTKYFLYKQKTLLSLKFLHSIIPRIQILEQNMTALVYKHDNEENESPSNENENYKVTDRKLDSDLLAIEKDVNQNRKHLTEYMDAYQNIEGEMKFLNDTMQRGFSSN